MFIEGIMDESYFHALESAGYDVVWVCKTDKDLKEHGYAGTHRDKAHDTTIAELQQDREVVARIFIDCDVENIITPTDLLNSVDKEEMPKYLAFDHAGLKGEISARLAHVEDRDR